MPAESLASKLDSTPLQTAGVSLLEEQRPLWRPGSVEPDIFVINDVVLNISPENISVQKRAFNHEYSTLRTTNATRIKSGHSVAYINISAIFKPRDFGDRLVPLIAGLRATPFASVYNMYLEKQLINTEAGLEYDSSSQTVEFQSSGFRSIVLALTNATFSTQGHVGAPDLIRAELSFIWFNYLPYTPIWAYKTGSYGTSPGYAWNSDYWKGFYAELEGAAPVFPHNVVYDETLFSWHEYSLLPQGSPLTYDLTQAIVDQLQSDPNKFLDALQLALAQGDTGKLPAGSTSALDAAMRSVVADGSLDVSKFGSTKEQIVQQGSPGFSAVAETYLQPTLTQALQIKMKEGSDAAKKYIKQNSSTLSEASDNLGKQADQLRQANPGGFDLQSEDFQAVQKVTAAYGQNSLTVGEFTLLGRMNSLRIHPGKDILETGIGSASIIEAINVTISNTLAIIPMSGYRYPTIQHIGSTDASVTFSLNATNEMTAKLQRMYDTVESMALRFRQVPASYLNLVVENDFLKLFKLREFITDGINSEAISDQPGRSRVALILTETAIKKTTGLQEPEQLAQEYLSSGKTAQKATWDILRKSMKFPAGKKPTGIAPMANPVLFPGIYYALENGAPTTPDQKCFHDLVEQARTNYNTWLSQVSSRIFDSDLQDGRAYFIALKSMKDDPQFSYVPGLSDAITSVENTNKYRMAGASSTGKLDVSYGSDSQASRDAKQKLVEEKQKYYSRADAEKATDKSETENTNRIDKIKDMGTHTYLAAQRQLFQEINEKYLLLPQFKTVYDSTRQLGFNRGLPAYPDFTRQLTGVIDYLATEQAGTVQASTPEQLIEMDPDVYMWYPLFSSGQSLIDETTKLHASTLALRAHDQAQSSVANFYSRVYVPRLKSSVVQFPSSQQASELAEPLYEKVTDYASASAQESIKKSILCDPGKAHTNIPTKNAVFSAGGIINHSSDFSTWMSGVPHGGVPQAGASPTNSAQPVGVGQPTLVQNKSQQALLARTHPLFTPKLKQVLDMLHARGHTRARMANTYRTAAEQYAAAAKGYGPARLGPHNWGFASDIIHGKYGWKVNPETLALYYDLRDICKQLGLEWGGNWFKKNGGAAWKPYNIGWDPAHVQMRMRDIPKSERRDLLTKQPARSVDPVSYVASTSEEQSSGITTSSQSIFQKAVNDFEQKVAKGNMQGLVRAYPAFKLYFIEDDSGERKRLAYDDFFSYNSVQSIKVVRSRKIAADLCEIYITNVSGMLSNRRFAHQQKPALARDSSGKIVRESDDNMAAGTVAENPIASMLLQEGVHISLRLGYSNDPDRLTTVFNGTITGIQMSDNEDIIRVVAQSYATELVEDIKGIEKPKTYDSTMLFGWDAWGMMGDASTSRILTEMLSEPEVIHFGRWKPGEATTQNRELLTNTYQFWPRPQDDNLFPPPRSEDMDKLSSDWVVKDLNYIIYKTTIWDIIKEMTFRHPNMIASPVPYRDTNGERMTLFFGLPDQLYFARAPDGEEQYFQEQLKQAGQQSAQQAMAKKDYLIGPYAKKIQTAATDAASRPSLIARLQAAQDAGYIKPFRAYHLITSDQHIISNNIRANARGVANTVMIEYLAGGVGGSDERTGATSNRTDDLMDKTDASNEVYTVKLDSALPTEDIQTQVANFMNVSNKELARRYGLSLLLENCRDIYQGDITIIGDPDIKPYDIIFCYDEYTDMVGPVEVEQVIHVFDQDNGFRTEITPDMVCAAGHWGTISSISAMAGIAEGVLQRLQFGGTSHRQLNKYSPFATMVGNGISAWGGFVYNMIMNFTPEGHPIVMTPLTLHGKPMAGGIPTRKIDTASWTNANGEWAAEVDKSYRDWANATYDGLYEWAKKWTGQYSQGIVGQ